MLKKIIKFANDTQCRIGRPVFKFIKYNTFTVIIAAIAFVAVASAVASNENIKKNVIGEEIVEKSGVDNSALLAADLENFDMAMEIIGVAEDAVSEEAELPIGSSASDKELVETGSYYIDYQYNTLGIQDDVWQKILRQKQMVVSKAALAGRDLGLYVSEELGEIIDNEIAYLKEVRKNEEEKGQTFVKETTKYTGLIGLVLNTKTKELPGYEPVVKPPVVIVQPEPAPINQPEPENPITLAPPSQGGDAGTPDVETPGAGTPDESQGTPTTPPDQNDDFAGAPEESDYPPDAPVWGQLTEENCSPNGGHWYNETCNAEAEIIAKPETESEPAS